MLNLLNYPIALAQPLRLTGLSTWQEHIPFAMFLVDLLRPAMIVELGAHAGDSYCAFCQAVATLELKTSCYAIDTWEGDEHAGFYGNQLLEELRSHHEPLYSGFSTLIQSTFAEAVSYFTDASIDLLHIDGLHTYEAVKEDFETWKPKLSSRAVVLFHDINVRERNFGAGRYWAEITTQYPHFEFPYGYGLGLLAVGEDRNEGLRALLDCNDQETALLRQFFFRLGFGVRMHNVANCRQKAINDQGEEIRQLHQTFEQARQRHDHLQQTIEHLQQTVKDKETLTQKVSQELVVERKKIQEIVESKGWQMLQRLWRIKSKLVR